jgi:hypothetical protein
MYLDKGAKKEDEPWYSKKSRKEEKYIDTCAFKRKEDKDNKRRSNRNPIKLLEDPLDMITSHLKKRERKDERHRYKQDSRRHKEDKYQKEKKKSSSSPSIEELRAKRLERERNEKTRVKQLYLGPNMEEEEEEQVQLDDRKRGYNSQFK